MALRQSSRQIPDALSQLFSGRYTVYLVMNNTDGLVQEAADDILTPLHQGDSSPFILSADEGHEIGFRSNTAADWC